MWHGGTPWGVHLGDKIRRLGRWIRAQRSAHLWSFPSSCRMALTCHNEYGRYIWCVTWWSGVRGKTRESTFESVLKTDASASLLYSTTLLLSHPGKLREHHQEQRRQRRSGGAEGQERRPVGTDPGPGDSRPRRALGGPLDVCRGHGLHRAPGRRPRRRHGTCMVVCVLSVVGVRLSVSRVCAGVDGAI